MVQVFPFLSLTAYVSPVLYEKEEISVHFAAN